MSDSLPIRELERRRLAATNALAAAVRRSTDDPTDREASVEVELHADAVRNYAEAIAAVTVGVTSRRRGAHRSRHHWDRSSVATTRR